MGKKPARRQIAKALLIGSLAACLAAGRVSAVFALTNTADITVAGSPTVFAIDTSLLPNEPVVNSGTLRATATAADPDAAQAYGLYATGTAWNTGQITAYAAGTGLLGTGRAQAYGIVSDGSLTNSGSIRATATASQAWAYGLYNTGGGITNSGEITVLSNGADIMSLATGIIGTKSIFNTGKITATAAGGTSFARGLDTPEAVTNSGEIAASASGSTSTAEGIFTDSITINSGRITATATATGTAQAYGMNSNSGGSISSSGALTISAEGVGANAFGLHFVVPGSADNSGSINVTARGTSSDALARGIYKADRATNSGAISATAAATSANAGAYGIVADGPVTNSGRIAADATSNPADAASAAIAYGVSATGTLVNSGRIDASASGFDTIAIALDAGTFDASNTADLTATAATPGSAKTAVAYGLYSAGATNSGSMRITAAGRDAFAYGIFATGPVSNTGNLTLSSTGTDSATTFGIWASPGGTVTNSGTISVSASGGTARAFGIYLGNAVNLTNTGVIRAPADNAYQVFIANGPTTLAGRYNMTLEGTPTKGSIYVDNTGTVDINSARLSVTAADARFNTEYRIFSGPGTVTGAFGSVSASNPAVSLAYHDQGTASSADDTVSISYHPATSAVQKGTEAGLQLVNTSLDPVRQIQAETFLEGFLNEGAPVRLASAPAAATDAPGRLLKRTPEGGVFFIPYAKKVNNSSDALGYDSTLYGFAGGCDWNIGRSQLGFHVGFGTADTSFSGREFPSNTKSEQEIISFGFQGLSRLEGNWILRGDATGYTVQNRHRSASGLNFEAAEHAAFSSYGTIENFMAGYAVKRGSHAFLPEIGVNHVWLRQGAFSSTRSVGGWQTSYSGVNHHQVNGLASVRWLTQFPLLNLTCRPSASIGGRYRLTNDSLTLEQTVPGNAPVSVAADQDRAAATASASMALVSGQTSAELAYSGEYSANTTVHGLWLKLVYAF